MPISERDFALLQEEVKCLRKKFSSTISTSGGYIDGSLTAPGSSVYPNSYYEDCGCVASEIVLQDQNVICSQESDEGYYGIGDLIGAVPDIGGVFSFDAVNGVYYLPPDSSTWDNRNTGLASTHLNHGVVDPWWYRKADANEDNIIIWQVGQGRIMRSPNAGRDYWQTKTPANLPSTSVTTGQIEFIQIIPDLFVQSKFYVLAKWLENGVYQAGLAKTTNDGQTWDWISLTYDSASQTIPLWGCQSNGPGNLLYVTAWRDGELSLLKLNNDPTITISSSYSLGSCTHEEYTRAWYIASPYSPVDGSEVFVFGRINDPFTLGLSHIIKSTDEALNWSVIENTWGEDWCGSFKTSMLDEGNNRVYYSVRNVR